MLNLAGQHWQANPDSVYAGAVLAALQWVASIRDEDPLSGQHRPATRSAQLHVRVAAGALTMGLPDPVLGITEPISPEWARGVEAALQWVVGANSTAGQPAAPPPIRGAIRGANYR